MGKSVAWDIHEAALLLQAYLDIEKKPTSREQCLSDLSRILRQNAVKSGIRIDEKFRNIPSLNYQYNKLRYLMTDGKYGFSGPVMPVISKIVELYKSARNDYEAILAEGDGTIKEGGTNLNNYEDDEAANLIKESLCVSEKIWQVPKNISSLPIQRLKFPMDIYNNFYSRNIYSVEELVDNLPDLIEVDFFKKNYQKIFACLNAFLDKYIEFEDNYSKQGDENTAPFTNEENSITLSQAIDDDTEAKSISLNGSEAESPAFSIEEKRELYSTPNEFSDAKDISTSQDSGQVSSIDKLHPLYLEDSISLLPLSNHLSNIFNCNRISTIGEFLQISEDEFAQIHGVGKKTLKEIESLRRKLIEEGYISIPSNIKDASLNKKRINLLEENKNSRDKNSRDKNKLNPEVETEIIMHCHLDDNIDVLPLSARLSNTLHRNGIDTIDSFLLATFSQMKEMRNMGEKSLAEATYFQELLAPLQETLHDQVNKIDERIHDLANELYKLHISAGSSVHELPISDLARQTLRDNKINNVGDFLKTPKSYWDNIKVCGNPGIRFSLWDLCNAFEYLQQRYSSIKTALVQFMGNLLGTGVWNSIFLYPEEEQLKYIWKNNKFIQYIKKCILQSVHAKEGISIDEIGQLIPMDLFQERSFVDVVMELVAEKKIKMINQAIYTYYMSLNEYIDSLTNENYKRVLRLRLKGYTLEEVGKEIGVTRERVRQILAKLLKKHPHLEDDNYLPLWEKYPHVTEDDFKAIFGWTQDRIYYLQWVSKSGSHSLTNITKSKKIRSDELQKMAQEFYTNESIKNKISDVMRARGAFLLIQGKKVQRDRPGIVRFVVQTYCQERKTIKDFLRIYDDILNEIGLSGNKSFILNGRTIENHLSRLDCVLWSRGKQLRYYDINDVDVDAFLEDINLYDYKDVEISTRKIYCGCPDVMEAYDIRDEYELHNLLKKIWDIKEPNKFKDPHHQVNFGRMPILIIGNGSRDKQVIDLLQNNSPIDRHDLANKYEELYGVRAGSASANFFNCIEQHRVGSTYSVNWKKLPEDEVQVLKSQLTNDFYFISDIRDKLLENFPDEKVWSINGHTLRQLGFLPYQDYVISSRYKNAIDYFRHILRQKVADLRDRTYLYSNGTFYAEIVREKATFDIIEVKPLIFYNRQHIESMGIHLEDFPRFWQTVDECINDGDFFSIYSLKKSGVTLPWENLQLPDWFYSSILCENKTNFVVTRYGNHRLFRKSSKRFSMADLIAYEVDKLGGHTEFHELIHKIQDDFGFIPKRDNLKQAIIENVDLTEKVEVY